MKTYHIIFQLIILLIIFFGSFFLISIEVIFPGISDQGRLLCFCLTPIIMFLLIIGLVFFFYDRPVRNLEFAIKSFLVGNLQDMNDSLGKSYNSNINYSLMFFKKTLNTLKNIKDEFMHGREIKGEVGLAKEIQSKMLAKQITQIPSLEMIFKSKPAGEIGGDSFDVIEQGNNYYIYVGDATGHGVGAGLIMTMVNALVSGFSKVYKSGADVLIKTNEILKPRVKANLLMSLLLIRWDESTKRLFMTGAGHEYLIIYKQEKKKTYKIKSGGVALGMVKDISKIAKEMEVQVDPGDIIVLYSDGITEAINRPKRDGSEILFGEDRLIESIQNAPNIPGKNYKSAQSIFNSITISLSKFMGYNYVQLDDVTLGVIQYKTADYKKEEDYNSTIPEEFITEWHW